MNKIFRLVPCFVLAFALTSCSSEDPDADVMNDGSAAPTGAAATAPAASPAAVKDPRPEVVMPVEVAANAIALGTSLQGGRVIPSQRPQVSLSDTVYAGVSSNGHPPGAEARIYWTYQDGSSHKEETKPLQSDGVTFSFGKADGMKPGSYMIQVDIAGKPVGIADLQVK